MHTIRRHALRFWLIRLLIGLMLLAPYLHGHVGTSVQSGLHLADMHSLATDASDPNGQGEPSEESRVVGVSPSLPQLGIDLLGLVGCAWVWGLLRLRAPGRPVQPQTHIWRGHLYRLGWPPPSLAPPRA